MPKGKSRKPKADETAKSQKHRNLIESDPLLTILSDHPLEPGDIDDDCFSLSYHIGPIYDIIRHPDTKPPMSIAIYGTWGAGKSSAMKWLNGLLDEWNETDTVKKRDGIKIKPVWFYPWKYQEREDVWKGLIAEVIIASIQIKGATLEELEKAAKQVWWFVGMSTIQAVGDVVGIDTEKIIEKYKESIQPHLQCLNKFEHEFCSWVQKTIGKNDRMVIFVDDLDRCMPEVALQVLEALKLYLNIDKLIFIVGVDREVIDELVKKHYEKLGLKEEKSGKYLAKMFQVEVDLNPTEALTDQYLTNQLKTITTWNKLEKTAQKIFRTIILKLAGMNPREVKRLINSALIAGSGTTKLTGKEDTPDFTLEQGMQIFFIRFILRKDYKKDWLVGREIGDSFFGEWSTIVRKNSQEDFHRSFFVPPDFLALFEPGDRGRTRDYKYESFVEQIKSRPEELDLSFAPDEYHDLLKNHKLSVAFELLSDPLLGELMRIEYPSDTIVIRQAVGYPPDEQIIREAIAKEVGKDIGELTADDYQSITRIDLSRSDISDLKHIKGLINLIELNLSDTKVSNIEPLSGLTNLSILDLDNTQPSDIEPLRELTNLSRLYLRRTKVNDIEPLSGLTNLSALSLFNTQVSDIESLRNSTSLQWLSLSDTQVSDIGPLRNLTSLRWLSLSDTQVNDIEPLIVLTNLSILNLRGTRVSDIKPLRKLINLSSLDLRGMHVSDIESLRKLINLSTLDLRGTQVSDIKSLRNLTKLRQLELQNTQVSDIEPLRNLHLLSTFGFSNTQVSDIEPLRGLTNLSILSFKGTQVSDIEPLRELSKLLELLLFNTQVSDIEPLRELINLSVLGLSDTQVTDIEPLRNLTNLRGLYLSNTQVSIEQVADLKMALPKLKIYR